ncbi:Hypothetical Protein FCC1311_002402, partial [Hondaea fermentalgiana]
RAPIAKTMASLAREEDFVTLVLLSDWMWAFSFLSLVTYVKTRTTADADSPYAPLPRVFLAFALLNSLLQIAGIMYPGAPIVGEIVQLVERAPARASKEPFQVGLLVLNNVPGSFQLMLSMCMLILNLSFVVAEVFAMITSLSSSSVRSETVATEKKVAKKAKTKSKADSKNEKAEEPVPSKETTLSIVCAEPASGSSKTILAVIAAIGVALSAYGCATSPALSTIGSVTDVFKSLPNFVPNSFGLFALLETLALVAHPEVLFVKVDGKLRATSAAHAAMIRILALVVVLGATSLRIVPDPEAFLAQQAPEVQMHFLVQLLHFLVATLFLLPLYVDAHPTVTMVFFLYIAAVFVCVINPKILANYNLEKRDMYIKITALLSCGMAIVLNSSYSAVCIALVSAVLINLHRNELVEHQPQF